MNHDDNTFTPSPNACRGGSSNFPREMALRAAYHPDWCERGWKDCMCKNLVLSRVFVKHLHPRNFLFARRENRSGILEWKWNALRCERKDRREWARRGKHKS